MNYGFAQDSLGYASSYNESCGFAASLGNYDHAEGFYKNAQDRSDQAQYFEDKAQDIISTANHSYSGNSCYLSPGAYYNDRSYWCSFYGSMNYDVASHRNNLYQDASFQDTFYRSNPCHSYSSGYYYQPSSSSKVYSSSGSSYSSESSYSPKSSSTGGSTAAAPFSSDGVLKGALEFDRSTQLYIPDSAVSFGPDNSMYLHITLQSRLYLRSGLE